MQSASAPAPPSLPYLAYSSPPDSILSHLETCQVCVCLQTLALPISCMINSSLKLLAAFVSSFRLCSDLTFSMKPILNTAYHTVSHPVPSTLMGLFILFHCSLFSITFINLSHTRYFAYHICFLYLFFLLKYKLFKNRHLCFIH